MEITLRSIMFKVHLPNGDVIEQTKPIAGDNEMVKWVAEQFAEVNNGGVTASFEDKIIATVGNVQS